MTVPTGTSNQRGRDPHRATPDTAEFEAGLRALGRRYHIRHPFHRLMAEGRLRPEQIRAWVANRFYYQVAIPRKDAALIANCPDRETRRIWVQRILAQDGVSCELANGSASESRGNAGGIEAWLRLGEACGLARETLWSMEGLLPGVRFAVDAYVRFVRDADWHDGICASLTELFAPAIHRQRLDNWPRDYPWIEPAGLDYFRTRESAARRDAEHALAVTLDRYRTPEQRRHALGILQFKLDVLWSICDALYLACVLEMPPYFNERETP